MRFSAVDATTSRLRNGACAVTLVGLLAACGDTSGVTSTGTGGSGGELTGVGGGVGASGGGSVSTSSGMSSGMGGAGGASSSSGASSSGTSSGASSSGSSSSSSGGVPPTVMCNPIKNGTVSLKVGGATRFFSVQMPANTSQVAVLFLWHGYLQIPTTFANEIVYDVPLGKWVPFDPNAFPMPLIIVTPYDTKMIPPWGLDWDIAAGGKDFAFFEAMLACLHDQFNVDDTRIYSFGFSAGAVFTNLLSAAYPHVFAATISESGAWFNDMAQWSDVSVPIVQWKWPAFNVADGGNVLLTHGGPNDFATVISLESAAQKAIPFLHNHGRTVMECNHTFGHTLDPDLTQAMYYQYMWAHKLGGPPLENMLPGWPTDAQPVGATACRLRPYP